MRRWMFWVRGSLHWPLYINALPTFLTDERFDDGEATKHVGRSAVRTPGATNVVGVKFNQSYASAVGGNRIGRGATTVADKIGHTTVCHNHEAAITIGPRSYFVRDDQVAAFVLVHIG